MHRLPEQSLQLLILVIPRGEHFKTLGHHLLKLVKRDVHEAAGAQYLIGAQERFRQLMNTEIHHLQTLTVDHTLQQ